MRRTAQGSAFAAVESLLRQRDVVILLGNAANPMSALPAFIRSIANLGPGATTGILYKSGADTAALLAYETGAFTPSFSFGTPGDLGVVYTIQAGTYVKVGLNVTVQLEIAFTPTYTTASGNAILTGLPFANHATRLGFLSNYPLNSFAWPTDHTTALVQIATGSTGGTFVGNGNAAAGGAWGVTQFPTATQRTLRMFGTYIANA